MGEASGKLNIQIITCGDILKYYYTLETNVAAIKMLPISPLRAIAHHLNPNADADDPCLLVASKGERIVGYLGLMPGILRLANETYKIFWFTTWYVDDSERKSMVGIKLIMKVMKLKLDLFVTGISPEAEEVYKGLRFKPIGPLHCSALLLDYKNPFFKLLNRFELSRANVFRNSTAGTKFLRMKKNAALKLFRFLVNSSLKKEAQLPEHISFKKVDQINFQAQEQNMDSQFYRSVEVINWMLQYPWLTDNQQLPDIPYQFSYKLPIFKYLAYEIFEAGEPIGYVVYSYINDTRKLKINIFDYYITHDKYGELIIKKGLLLCHQHNINNLVVPEPLYSSLSPGLKNVQELFTRSYYCYIHTKAIKEQVENIQLQYVDGDLAFV